MAWDSARFWVRNIGVVHWVRRPEHYSGYYTIVDDARLGTRWTKLNCYACQVAIIFGQLLPCACEGWNVHLPLPSSLTPSPEELLTQ